MKTHYSANIWVVREGPPRTMWEGKEPMTQIDRELLRNLADVLITTGLSEIEYCSGDVRVRMARRDERAFQQPPAGQAKIAPAQTSGGTLSRQRVGIGKQRPPAIASSL